jgi:hypothetical protein
MMCNSNGNRWSDDVDDKKITNLYFNSTNLPQPLFLKRGDTCATILSYHHYDDNGCLYTLCIGTDKIPFSLRTITRMSDVFAVRCQRISTTLGYSDDQCRNFCHISSYCRKKILHFLAQCSLIPNNLRDMGVVCDEVAVICRRLSTHVDEIITMDFFNVTDYSPDFGISMNTKIFHFESICLFLWSVSVVCSVEYGRSGLDYSEV